MLKDCRVVLIPTDHSEKSIIVHETSMMFSENLLTSTVWQHSREGKDIPDSVKGLISNGTFKVIATTDPSLTIREIKGGEGDIIVKGINTPGVSRGFIDRFCGNNGSIVDIQVDYLYDTLQVREDNTIIIRQAQKYKLDDINTIVCNNTNYTSEEVNNWFKL